ncbi:MAG: protein kinase, partial [Candidatus Eisenbacteria bacterium]|nr:protein kinase [Candidatus Eisenbacteria bacterium]
MAEHEKPSAKDIFLRALEQSPEQRAAFLDEACAGDETLRGEVEKLLRAHEGAGEFFAAPTVDVSPRDVATAEAQPPPAEESVPARVPVDVQRGTLIGSYKILQEIGEGGFGVVYLAEQEEPIRRRVALKIIKLGMDTRDVIARFEAERQALAMMDHPNIAKVHDAGATEAGRPYFVMELVKGVPITEYCDVNNLTTRERLELFMEVCRALQHAHQKGVIHRDVKPSNILVTLHDGKPVPKVIDFGIAKATKARLTEKTVFTESGQMIGTPVYMSPEQAEMSGLDIDTRSDIYSLGVVLYELLTGTTPFDPETLVARGYAEIQRIIREEEPSRPSTRISSFGEEQLTAVANHRRVDSKSLGKLFRGDLDWIVMKALEKDRTRRYETASEFAADITRHLSHDPVVASPPSVTYRLKKFLRKNRGPVAAAGVTFLVLLTGLVATTAMYIHAERERGEKETALTEKTEALRRSEGLRLAAQATKVLPSNPGLALLLGIEAAQRAPGLEANEALLGALQNLNEARAIDSGGGTEGFARFSPNGRRLVTISPACEPRLWDAETGKELAVLRGHESQVYSVSFSPDSQRIVTVGSARYTSDRDHG